MKIVLQINKVTIYYLPIENNVFDGLYKKIMDVDNDIIDTNSKHFDRNMYINCFLKMLDDVNETLVFVAWEKRKVFFLRIRMNLGWTIYLEKSYC